MIHTRKILTGHAPLCLCSKIGYITIIQTIKLKLKAINLSESSIFKLSAHIWISEKKGWYEIPDGVNVFENQHQPTRQCLMRYIQ